MKKITQLSILRTVIFTLATFSIQTVSAVTVEPFVVTAIEANGNDFDSSLSTDEKLDLEVVFNSSQASTLNIALQNPSLGSSLDFIGTFLNSTNTPWKSFSLMLNDGAKFAESSDIDPFSTFAAIDSTDDTVIIRFYVSEEDGFEFGLGTPWQIDTSAVGIGNSFDIVVTPETVPIPAAIWLFGSGLIGMISGVRQRKN
jgi:hypothetical protein